MNDSCSCESIVCSLENGTCNVIKDRFLYPNVPFAPKNIVANLCEQSCAFIAKRPCHDSAFMRPTGDVSAFLDSVLVQGVRFYVQKGNTQIIPRHIPFQLPSAVDCIPYDELGRRTNAQSLLWLYNLDPHRPYVCSFGSYRHQKIANENGLLFPFDKHPFPLGKYTLHVECGVPLPKTRNTFISTNPTAISQSPHAMQVDTQRLIHRQLELHAPSNRIMCAVSNEPSYTPDHFVVHENNGEWFLL